VGVLVFNLLICETQQELVEGWYVCFDIPACHMC